MLRSAVEHERAQREIQRSALTQARSLRRSSSVERLWRSLSSWQALSAVVATRWLPEMLEEQGLTAPAVAPLVVAAQVGTASDGRSLGSLLEYAVRESTAHEFDTIVATQLQDVARSTLATDIATRPAIEGYVRQITAGACSRCAILAGRFYRWNEGFDRHPNCNCEHIPTTRDNAGEVATDPREYFDSLDEAEQDRIFSKAGAEAIRMGADPVQVVNARSGMTTAQPTVKVIGQREVHLDVAGQRITTFEPITETVAPSRRRLIRDEGGLYTTETGALSRASRQRMGLAKGERRLMPESILELSNGAREQALALLQRYGYIR